MKKITALLLALILAVTSAIPAFAETDQFFSSVSENTAAELVPVEAEEEKIYCDATLDDDFADDSVIVMLKNDVSLELNDYDKYDFSEIDVEKVEDLTSYTVEAIQEQHLQLNSLSVNSTATADEAINDEIVDDYEDESENNNDYSSFHRIIKLDLKTKSKQAVLDAIDELEDRDDVLTVEPDYITEICAAPNDSYYSKQWAANKINLPAAWNITTGSSDVTVGVIDTGIKRAHSDLTANVDTTLSNSFVDNSPFTDSNGHGTHVAGIIGAVGNNNRGISGACWNINLVSLKTSINGSMRISDVINAVEYAQSKGITIINCSASFPEDNKCFLSAIKNYDGLFVCSAGNDNKNIDNQSNGYIKLYPSVYKLSNVISVAATDENDVFGLVYTLYGVNHYSNYGASSVNIAAPGCSIYSTYNGDTSDKYYAYMGGTSMAAPYVAGVAALIKSKYPNITNYGMRSAILDGSDKTSYLSGKVKSGGRLNAYKAITDVPNHKFTVKYNKNGGTGSTMSDTAVTYGIPVNLKANTYSKTGYKFKGWYAHRQSDNKWYYKGSGGTGWYVEGQQPSGYSKCLYVNKASIAHTSGTRGDVVTMYAQWEPITYTLIFDANGGGGPHSMPQQNITYGQNTKISKNVYLKGGYYFDGWTARRTSDNKWYYTNGSSTGWYVEGTEPDGYTKFKYNDQATIAKTSSVDGDKVYMYAQWAPNSYTIKFDPGDGNGTMADITGYTDIPLTLSSNTFTKQNYSFLGWYLCDEYGYWSCTGDEWLDSGIINKKLYYNTDEVVYQSDSNGDTVTAYAQWIKTDTIILGDANLDGEITVDDATFIQKCLASLNNYSEANKVAADVNRDGKMDVNDANLILQYVSGAITGF